MRRSIWKEIQNSACAVYRRRAGQNRDRFAPERRRAEEVGDAAEREGGPAAAAARAGGGVGRQGRRRLQPAEEGRRGLQVSRLENIGMSLIMTDVL
jgi:hypothetical protein